MGDELEWRFIYHSPKNDDIIEQHRLIRLAIFETAKTVEKLCPESRERALAYTRLEEAMFWANAAIARIKNYQE